MRISDWSSDVCSSDLANDALINARLDGALLFEKGISSINYSTRAVGGIVYLLGVAQSREELEHVFRVVRSIPNVKRVVSHVVMRDDPRRFREPGAEPDRRSEEHTSELQSLMRISYAVFCLKKKKQQHTTT